MQHWSGAEEVSISVFVIVLSEKKLLSDIVLEARARYMVIGFVDINLVTKFV